MENRPQVETKKGYWVPAIEEPYYHLFRKGCRCGKKFWKKENYEMHYAYEHLWKGN